MTNGSTKQKSSILDSKSILKRSEDIFNPFFSKFARKDGKLEITTDYIMKLHGTNENGENIAPILDYTLKLLELVKDFEVVVKHLEKGIGVAKGIIDDQKQENEELKTANQEYEKSCNESKNTADTLQSGDLVNIRSIPTHGDYSNQIIDEVKKNGILINEVKTSLEWLKEKEEREYRQKNIIVFGCTVNEDDHTTKCKLDEIFHNINVKVSIERFHRIGKDKNIIKVRLATYKEVKEILKNAHKLKYSEKCCDVFLTPDRTYKQRIERQELVKDLKNKKNMEPNKTWIIKQGKVVSLNKDLSKVAIQNEKQKNYVLRSRNRV